MSGANPYRQRRGQQQHVVVHAGLAWLQVNTDLRTQATFCEQAITMFGGCFSRLHIAIDDAMGGRGGGRYT